MRRGRESISFGPVQGEEGTGRRVCSHEVTQLPPEECLGGVVQQVRGVRVRDVAP